MSPKVTASYTNDKVKFILKSAKDVFIRKGFYDTTMQDIVNECNISRGGLYRYFSSTKEIFMDVMINDIYQDEDAINHFIENDWSAVQILNTFIDEEKKSILNIWSTLIPAIYEFYIRNMRDNSSDMDFLSKRREIALETLSRVIDYGIQREELSKEIDSYGIAMYIMNFLEGLIVSAITIGINENLINSQIKIFNDFIKMYIKKH